MHRRVHHSLIYFHRFVAVTAIGVVASALLLVAAGLLLGLIGSRETPERIIHLIAKGDPTLAAELTMSATGLHGRGAEFLTSALNAFAYDAYWSERSSGPNVDSERFAEYVAALADRLGELQVAAAMADVIETLAAGAAAGDLEASGVEEFRQTAEAALNAVSGDTADVLRRIVERSNLGR
jgi:hypothetical protein